MELLFTEFFCELLLLDLHFVLLIAGFIVLYPQVDELFRNFCHYSLALLLELFLYLFKLRF